MDKNILEEEYKKYKPYFIELQKEVYNFMVELKDIHIDVIHIERIDQRPNNDIKQLDSILRNINNPKKYLDKKTLFDIGDIAGIRVTCHCISDRENLFQLLEGELSQKYKNVVGDRKNGHYHAYHYNFIKEISLDDKIINIPCEIQLRTVLGNAWAIQDHKYVYKGKNTEGDPVILSRAISDILNSCESLWDLVKEKCSAKKILKSKESFNIKKYENLAKVIQESVAKQTLLNRDLSAVNMWMDNNRNTATKGMKKLSITGSMEIQMYLPKKEINISSKKSLVDAARGSTIKTFGWPIGLVMDKEEYRPKPTKEGILTEIPIKQKGWFDDDEKMRISYDYWSLKQDGSYYLLKSIFEDTRNPKAIFFNTRIVRITETLLFAKNLYKNLNVDNKDIISIKIKHGGLKGRAMSSVGNRLIFESRTSIEDEVETKMETSINDIENNIVDLVEKFTAPLFEVFDFFTINRKVLEDIVVRYIRGEVS